ncbi:MAG: glycosyltransferase [Anaerolineae bacterium]|nr:glycosyltransferase [Anaerolineae bacterium]
MESIGQCSPVSVIVLNYNSRAHLPTCLSSLQKLDYPRHNLEIILADNGSTDGSVDDVRTHFPTVRVIEHGSNEGFARGNNLAAQASTARYVAFLNPDMRVEPGWLETLVSAVEGDARTVCAAAKILSWDGKTVDFVGSQLNFYGHGFNVDYGRPYQPELYDQGRVIPFACGGAMLIDREVFLSSGGFDEDYFAYFEDVDLGWRLNLFGYRVVLAPQAVTFHHHHGSWGKRPSIHRLTLLERNAFYTVIKNYQDEHLDRILSLSLFLAVKRALIESEVNPDEFHYAFKGVSARRPRTNVPKAAFCPLVAIDQVIQNLPRLLEKRQVVQAMRREPDSEFFTRFAEGLLFPNNPNPHFVAAQSTLVRHWPVPDFFRQSQCQNLLIIAHDTIGDKMAGPAIRYWELANVLSKQFNVTLMAPGQPGRSSSTFRVLGYQRMDQDAIRPLLVWADVVFVYCYLLNELPLLKTAGKPLILDLYDPYVLENLETFRTLPLSEQQDKHAAFLGVLNQQLAAGDFFVCASERQRHFWLGMLAANGRVNPSVYDQDKTLHDLIDVVPFGLPSRRPEHRKRVLKGIVPGISEADKVILWGGGIWEWFDPLTLIQAMAHIARQRSDVKLFFMGKGHFDPAVVPTATMAGQAVALAQELGLRDKSVFFGDWIPYDERENYLLEADLGVSLHFDHIETRFSFRTRFLDYIWAGLPVVATKGDYLGDLLGERGLGQCVPAQDVPAVVRAVLELVDVPDLKQRLAPEFACLACSFEWEAVAAPIARFCQRPWHAPDRPWLHVDVTASPIKPPPWWTLPGKAWDYLRRGGPMALWRAAGMYLRWVRIIRRRSSGEGL